MFISIWKYILIPIHCGLRIYLYFQFNTHYFPKSTTMHFYYFDFAWLRIVYHALASSLIFVFIYIICMYSISFVKCDKNILVLIISNFLRSVLYDWRKSFIIKLFFLVISMFLGRVVATAAGVFLWWDVNYIIYEAHSTIIILIPVFLFFQAAACVVAFSQI